MKKKLILLPVVAVFAAFVLTGYNNGVGTHGYEYTGASGTARCGSCHGSAATASTTVTIQLLSGGVPVTSYTGGSAYTIVLTGTQTSTALILPYFGFQLSAVKTGTTTNAGTLTAPAGTHAVIVSGITDIEHYPSPLASTTGTGGSGTTYVVSIPWTAPVAGTGNVTIFGILNAVNHNGNDDNGDKWNFTSLAITEAGTSLPPITGTLSTCVGTTTTLSDPTTGGTWSSGTPAVATVGSATGIVNGLTAGTATITYTVGTLTATAVVTINPLPAAIGGTATVCSGGTTTLTDASAGGAWSIAPTTIGTISATGALTGIAPGTATVTYTLPTTCSVSATVTVTSLSPITGLDTVCTGHTITEADATPGGSWTSGTTSIATIAATTGIVSGVTAGSDIITYSLPSGCNATRTIYVTQSPPGTITGPATVCLGGTNTLTGSIAGGTWTMTNSHATIGATTGLVTGVSLGLDTAKYTVTNSCGTGTVTRVVTVLPLSTCHTGVASTSSQVVDQLNVFPNPACDGRFTLNLVTDNDEVIQIVITDVVGHTIRETTGTSNNDIDIQLASRPGIYFVAAETTHGKYISKVIIK